jgi:hypothetical protein
MKDPVVEEMHKQRTKRAAAFKHDLDAMVKDLKRREAKSRRDGVKFVTPPRRKKPRVG